VAKTIALDAPTLAWARGVFARYYEAAAIDPPSRLNRREFAAFPFAAENLMRRHASLRTSQEFRAFLGREAPRHVYYSSAYYRHPDAGTMAAKEWLGADLIFDLDSDHLRGAESLDYAAQLRRVKTRLTELVDDFLFGDFGVDPKATDLVFSGGRGYHVHVHDERFLSLTSPERRELVEYVQGSGFDPMRVVEDRRADVRSGRLAGSIDDEAGEGSGRALPKLRNLAPPDSPGWKGRTTRALLAVLARWEAGGADLATDEMVRAGVPRAKARQWAKRLVVDGGAAKIRAGLSLEISRQSLPAEVLEAVVGAAKIEVQGETDAPVTTDIHRLIRLPGSLHGGTGFRVVPLTRDALDKFDPFSDALLTNEDGETTTVSYREPVRYPFPGEELVGAPGQVAELPTPVALFLVLRGEAELRPSPG
jgi:DNA primase small subunit